MTEPGRTAVIVLAAGAGTRMKSKTPKILHAIGGRTLVGHALTGAAGIDPDFLVAVVSHERERVTRFGAPPGPLPGRRGEARSLCRRCTRSDAPDRQ